MPSTEIGSSKKNAVLSEGICILFFHRLDSWRICKEIHFSVIEKLLRTIKMCDFKVRADYSPSGTITYDVWNYDVSIVGAFTKKFLVCHWEIVEKRKKCAIPMFEPTFRRLLILSDYRHWDSWNRRHCISPSMCLETAYSHGNMYGSPSD